MDEDARVTLLEIRASIAELRASNAEQFSRVFARLDTIVGAIAELRAEYNTHTHE